MIQPLFRLQITVVLLLCLLAGRAIAQEKHTRSAGLARQGHSARLSATDPDVLWKMIVDAAAEAGISPFLLKAVVHQESTGKWWVVSPKGARGLTQLMPFTARRFGVRDIFDPVQNLRGGARYLRYLLDYFKGDVRLALAGYNAGEGAVDKYGKRIPPYAETQNYVARIYPRFVTMATEGRSSVVQTSLRPAASIAAVPPPPPAPLQLNSKARALALTAGGRNAAEEAIVPVNESRKEEAATRSTGASVYFWQPPARLPASVVPHN